ncbi:hypothetical protein ACOYW6_12965 [Parablastomonas sp. CN1-191]|uniref:hypothetical protein n=1 Tax=Parablastomonas sp. CN1-191 TaxID=3400908 RepID=UPI003BF8F8E6
MVDAAEVDQIKAKTLEMLGKPDLDTSYITHQSVQSDRDLAGPNAAEKFTSDDGKRVFYVCNARYGEYQGQQGYFFDYGNNIFDPGWACFHDNIDFVPFDSWDHDYQGVCPDGYEWWSLTER